MDLDVARHRSAMEIVSRGLSDKDFHFQFRAESSDRAAGQLYGFDADVAITPPSERLYVIFTGWAAVVRDLTADRGQVISLLLPGDLIPGRESDYARSSRVMSLTKISLFGFAHNDEPSTGVDNALGAQTARERACERLHSYVFDHVVRLGLLTAYERMGHFLLEIHERLNHVGLVTSGQFLLPISQEKIGRILGLSEAHVNRVLKQLRHDDLVHTGPGWVRLANYEALMSRVFYTPCEVGSRNRRAGAGMRS